MKDLFDIFGEELVDNIFEEKLESSTEQIIHVCFVLYSDIDVLSHERSFDGGDYTLKVQTHCNVYCNKFDELTDVEIIALRTFASKFDDEETVETTWGESNWYDKSGTIVSEKECYNLFLELNKETKRFKYVNDYMSLQNLPLVTRKENSAIERRMQNAFETDKFNKEIKRLKIELQSKIDSLNREYSTKIDIVEKTRIRKIYEFYRKEILDFDYVGNRYIEEIGKYIIELSLAYDDNDFLSLYLKKYSDEFLYIEDSLKKYLFNLLNKQFIRKVIDKAESLVPTDTFYTLIDSLTNICVGTFPNIYVLNDMLPHLIYYKINHSIKCHDIKLLNSFLNELSSSTKEQYNKVISLICDNYNITFTTSESYDFGLLCSIEKKNRQELSWESYEEEIKEILVWWSHLHNMTPAYKYKCPIPYIFNFPD